MKRICVFFVCLWMCAGVFAQEKLDVRMLILAPANYSCDPALKKAADSITQSLGEKVSGGIPANKITSFAIFEYLHLFLGEYNGFTGAVMLLADTAVTPGQTDLRQLAQKYNVTYVLNIPEVAYYIDNKQPNIRLTAELYEVSKNAVLLQYAGNQFKLETEFNCNELTLACAINNCSLQAASDIFDAMSTTHPVLKNRKANRDRESELWDQRTELLKTKYFNQPWSDSLARAVIDPKDSTINIKDMFQNLQNKERTRFVAFFFRRMNKTELQQASPWLSDDSLNIALADTVQPLNSYSAANVVGYVVRGIKLDGKWHYEKYHTIFQGAQTLDEGRRTFFADLRDWNFFTDNDTTFNPDFWETGLFAKVPDLRKHPDWERNKSMWESQEEANRDYIGMYEIVANELRQQANESKSKFAQDIYQNYLKPLTTITPIHEYGDEDNDVVLIYPKDRSKVISPVIVTDNKGVRRLKYYVILPNTKEIYEWTLFSYTLKDDTFVNSVILDQISSLTKWDFSKETLNDEVFWNKHVLQKKYLKPVK